MHGRNRCVAINETSKDNPVTPSLLSNRYVSIDRVPPAVCQRKDPKWAKCYVFLHACRRRVNLSYNITHRHPAVLSPPSLSLAIALLFDASSSSTMSCGLTVI
jgi:hypothetical protein